MSTQYQNAGLARCLLPTLKSKKRNQKGPRRDHPVGRRKPKGQNGGGEDLSRVPGPRKGQSKVRC